MRTITDLACGGVIALAIIGTCARADSGPDEADICLDAAAAAARDSGVPEDVLIAVSMVETGQDGQPWPWAVNIGGESHRPGTEDDAVRLVELTLQSGITNIDLGCFQLNLHWHSKGFQSVEDMLDPISNAQYAAHLLAGKYDMTGD